MGRWTQYDEDAYRLPEGMKRVGYDADTSKYYFRDQDGSLWESAEGSQYGELRQVTSAPIVLDSEHDEDEEATVGSRTDGYQPLANEDGSSSYSYQAKAGNAQAYRALFPFLMMIAVVLLLVWRLFAHTMPSTAIPDHSTCSGFSHAYRINAGDTCWDIAQSRGFSVEDLLEVNEGLACERLTPGEIICLPLSDVGKPGQ